MCGAACNVDVVSTNLCLHHYSLRTLLLYHSTSPRLHLHHGSSTVTIPRLNLYHCSLFHYSLHSTPRHSITLTVPECGRSAARQSKKHTRTQRAQDTLTRAEWDATCFVVSHSLRPPTDGHDLVLRRLEYVSSPFACSVCRSETASGGGQRGRERDRHTYRHTHTHRDACPRALPGCGCRAPGQALRSSSFIWAHSPLWAPTAAKSRGLCSLFSSANMSLLGNDTKGPGRGGLERHPSFPTLRAP